MLAEQDFLCKLRFSLWRAIYLQNNPDGEVQTNSLRAGVRKQIAPFKGDWDAWIELIELIQTHLVNLNDPFTDREFRELIYKAMAVEND